MWTYKDFSGTKRFKSLVLRDFTFNTSAIYLKFDTLCQRTSDFVVQYDYELCELKNETIVFKLSGVSKEDVFDLVYSIEASAKQLHAITLEFFTDYVEILAHNGTEEEEGWITEWKGLKFDKLEVFHAAEYPSSKLNSQTYKAFSLLSTQLEELNKRLNSLASFIYEPESTMRSEKLLIHIAHAKMCVTEELEDIKKFLTDYISHGRGFYSNSETAKLELQKENTSVSSVLRTIADIQDNRLQARRLGTE